MGLARQHVVNPKLQQLLTGMGSRALANVVLSFSSPSGELTLPSSSATAVRRSLFYSGLDTTQATPGEFDVFVRSLNGSRDEEQLTVPR